MVAAGGSLGFKKDNEKRWGAPYLRIVCVVRCDTDGRGMRTTRSGAPEDPCLEASHATL